MADSVYNISKANIDTSDLRVLLVKSTYSFNADHDYVNDVVANEADFTNYTRKALTGESHTIDTANDRAKLDADNPSTWSSAGGATNNTLGGMVVYEYAATDSAAKLVTFHDTNISGLTTNGGDLTIQFHATNGIMLTT